MTSAGQARLLVGGPAHGRVYDVDPGSQVLEAHDQADGEGPATVVRYVRCRVGQHGVDVFVAEQHLARREPDPTAEALLADAAVRWLASTQDADSL